jgi:hypothetical protein
MRLIISSAGSQHKAGAMHMHMCLCMHMLQGRSFIDPSVRKRGTNVGAGTDTRPRGSSLQGLPRLTMRLPEDRTNIVVNGEPKYSAQSIRPFCSVQIGVRAVLASAALATPQSVKVRWQTQ